MRCTRTAATRRTATSTATRSSSSTRSSRRSGPAWSTTSGRRCSRRSTAGRCSTLLPTPAADFQAIIDEETKVRSRTPHVSKFRDWPVRPRRRRAAGPLRRARRRVGARARATSELLRGDVRRLEGPATDRARALLGRLQPGARRRRRDDPRRARTTPTSSTSCATRGRRTPTRRSARCRCRSSTYVTQWAINQHAARSCAERFPDRMHVVRFEDSPPTPSALARCARRSASTPVRRSLGGPTLERPAPRRGLPVGHDPRADRRGQPRHAPPS